MLASLPYLHLQPFSIGLKRLVAPWQGSLARRGLRKNSFSGQAAPCALATLNHRRPVPREAEPRRYQAFFEASPLSQVVVGQGGEIQEINRLGAQLLGRRAEDLIGTSFRAHLHAGDGIRFDEHLAETLATGEGGHRRLRVKRADGQVAAVLVHSSRVDLEGEALCSLTLTDVGARPEWFPEVIEQVELWAEVVEEMRMPLASIIGFAGMLRERTSAENREYATAIGTRARRLLNRLGGVVELARIQAPGAEAGWERVDLVAEVRQHVERLQLHVDALQVRLEAQLPDHAVWARLHASAFGRVVTNLTSLAFERANGGEVELSAERVEGEIKICIRATTALERGCIWDAPAAYNGRPATTPKSLDLAITKRLAEAIKGRLEVYLPSDQEQVFVLYFREDPVS